MDAGLSFKQTCERLQAADALSGRIDGIVISHEHSDHVAGLPVLAKKLDAPVYMTAKAAPGIVWNGYEPKLERFQAGSRLSIGDIEVTTFSVPHDTIDPIGFCFEAAGIKIGLVTDLGYVPDSVKFHLRGTQLLILEANHDLEMLKVGPRPWFVKQRLMSRTGHLSNDAAAEFLRYDLDPATDTVVLAHLSEDHNYPALVELTARQALDRRGAATRLVVVGHGRPAGPFLY